MALSSAGVLEGGFREAEGEGAGGFDDSRRDEHEELLKEFDTVGLAEDGVEGARLDKVGKLFSGDGLDWGGRRGRGRGRRGGRGR